MPATSDATAVATGGTAGRHGLILDSVDYGRAVLLQGSGIDWEPAAHLRFLGQIGALLRPDFILVDLGSMVRSALASREDLVAAMGARSRTGYAVRTLLADERIGESALELLRVATGSSPLPVVVQLPSPEVWLRETAGIAGVVHEADDDDRENASVYFADWLRRFAETGLDSVLLDGRTASQPEELSLYGPVTRLAEHYRWGVLLRGPNGVQTLDGTAAELPSGFWLGEEVAVPEASLLVSSVPPNANPEHVLQLRKNIVAGGAAPS